jgi:hypothetical protein
LAVYGIEKEDILKFQKPPLSFLENPYTKDFINPESIGLQWLNNKKIVSKYLGRFIVNGVRLV